MIDPAELLGACQNNGVRFFAGVPDSLLQVFCAHLAETLPPENHIIAANEGSAVALAAGFHLATGGIGCVYMQNSGLGNAVNPLTSLVDPEVYGIPMLVLTGWRGEMRDGKQLADEPQHVKQGRITLDLLNCLDIPFAVLEAATPDVKTIVRQSVGRAKSEGRAVALVVRKGAFGAGEASITGAAYPLNREQALQELLPLLPANAVLVSTTGKTSRELFEIRTASGQNSERDFLTVGSMGHALQIATGIALTRPDKRIICIDGDGALIMHMGGMTTSATAANLIHVVMNNGMHESVGGQPTRGFAIDMPALALALGYGSASRVEDGNGLAQAVGTALASNRSAFIEMRIAAGSRADLGRPKQTPKAAKERFMQFLDAPRVGENR